MADRETQSARMNDEQEGMHSAFHTYAYGLLREGHRQAEIAQMLIEQGIEQSLAHDISSFAAVSYHSDRREALQNQLGRGLLFLIGYWTLLLGGYLLGGMGVWRLVDKRAMRLRTGDPEVDALTPAEIGKAGKFLLMIAGVIVLHVVVSQLFFRGGGEGVVNRGFLSPLFTAFDSPLSSE